VVLQLAAKSGLKVKCQGDHQTRFDHYDGLPPPFVFVKIWQQSDFGPVRYYNFTRDSR